MNRLLAWIASKLPADFQDAIYEALQKKMVEEIKERQRLLLDQRPISRNQRP